MTAAAILPVKRFSAAKQRLQDSIPDALRAELAQAMVGDVLSALGECALLQATIVVTCEPQVAAAARDGGASVVHDALEQGQSAAVALGVRRALEQGATRALCIPGDCPALDSRDLDALLATPSPPSGAEVVIVPDRHGSGTNGLLLSPPDAIAPSFGADSRARHERLARAAGASVRVERVPSLLLDVDTGEDLQALREHGLCGPRTRAVLAGASRAA